MSGAEYDKTIEYDGIRQKVVPTIEKKGLAAVSSSFFAALCSAFGRYDVVHIHAEGPAFFCWIPKLFGKGKCIHGSTAKSAIGMMEAEFWKWKGTYKYIDTMICCSEFMKSKMDSNPLFATKTVAMHNFIDKVEWKETEKKDYVLYFGRFSEEKGIGTLIKVCKELPDVQFIFAGTGPLEETVNGIKNIKNVGFQKGEALEKLIREARFSIYPSEWYENCPFSVMESQMYGTPVLGANIGGIPELIQVGKTGELFESGNGKDLKEKIEKLWGDKKLCAEYSANCKDISFDTIDEYYEKIMKVYQ